MHEYLFLGKSIRKNAEVEPETSCGTVFWAPKRFCTKVVKIWNRGSFWNVMVGGSHCPVYKALSFSIFRGEDSIFFRSSGI